MASLRQSYEDWIDNDPADIDDENPTDEMMANFENQEVKHRKQFQAIVQQAHRFSQSLGVKKLSDEETLSPALAGFVKEGIRFSFSNSDDLMLGSRLTFLSIFIKYAHWIKRDPAHQNTISEYLHEKELELKRHEDFEEVHEDDLAALAEFRTALGLGDSNILSADASTLGDATSLRSAVTPRSAMTPHSQMDSATQSQFEDDESRDTVNDMTVTTPATSAARKSRGSSVGSVRSATQSQFDDDESRDTVNDMTVTTPATSSARKSRGSSVGSVRSILSSVEGSVLSPLYEGGNEDDSGGSPSTPAARSKRSRYDASVVSKQSGYDSSMASPNAYSRTQSTFDGEQSDLESPHKGEQSDLESPHKGEQSDLESPHKGEQSDLESPHQGEQSDLDSPHEGEQSDLESPHK